MAPARSPEADPAPGPGGFEALRHGIERYYTATLARFGATPLGVDWSCVPSQRLRFIQLLKLVEFGAPFTLDDVGCGYGDLLAHLADRHPASPVDYLGLDLSPAMIRQARRRWRGHRSARFLCAGQSPRRADYTIASGIFNVMPEPAPAAWEAYVAATLRQLHAGSRRGFAVNFIAGGAATAGFPPGLYRTPPAPWIDFCEAALGCTTALVQGYGMREFTLLARPRQPAEANG